MIITQTPLRISLVGGGTDLPAFYDREPGAVVSCTIDKYIYVIAKERYDDRLRAGYTRTELVERVEDLEHDLVREAFRMAGISEGVEVATLADIPTRGSGLGSSSAVSVGLLHALWVHLGRLPSRRDLAEWACQLEITHLLRPIGKQDQYATAYGGVRYLEFTANAVTVGDRLGDPDTLRRLSESLLLFYTGQTRHATDVLREQDNHTERNRETLRAMKLLADAARDAIESGDVDAIGPLMHEGWVRKRTLARGIANARIDAMYEAALCAGATGGKLCGAGGGGFVLVYAPPASREAVRHALTGYSELEFTLEPSGTRVLANVTRGPAWQRRRPRPPLTATR